MQIWSNVRWAFKVVNDMKSLDTIVLNLFDFVNYYKMLLCVFI